MRLRIRSRNLPLTSLGLALLLLLSHIAFDPQLSFLRGRTFDLYQVVDLGLYRSIPLYRQLFPKPERPVPIVLVTIGEDALEQYGRWPWNRGAVADLVRAIDRNGAGVIALDMIFPEPDTSPGGAEGDAALEDALAATNSVLAASANDVETAVDVAPRVGYNMVGAAAQIELAKPGVTASIPAINDAAAGVGIIRSDPDPDGILRSLPLVWLAQWHGTPLIYPSFATEIVRVAAGDRRPGVRMNPGGFSFLRLAGVDFDVSLEGKVRLVENVDPYPRVSAANLLAGGDAPQLQGAIAILSFNAVGLDTFHQTPAVALRLGTEIHALLIEQLLTGQALTEPDNARIVERAGFGVAAIALLLVMALAANRLSLALPVIVMIIAAPLIAGFVAYELRHELYETIQPAMALFVVAAAEGLSLFNKSEQRRLSLTRQFSRFLSPEVVKALAAGDADTLLSVDKREITVMMIDLRGFTTKTNALKPEQTVDLVNHFLSLATKEIFARRGTVDKFIGDAVLAFWNAPLDETHHTELALETAEAILVEVERRNPEIEARGLPALQIGAALETGICSVGNFGSSLRIDYTAIGAAVNGAARLEAATKTLGVPLVTGPGFAARTSRELVSIGEIELRGFSGMVKVSTTPHYAQTLQAAKEAEPVS